MEPTREFEPQLGLDERRQTVAAWIQSNYHPALRVITEANAEEVGAQTEEFQIREYQLEAWANIWEARQEGKTRALLHLATGLGKTTAAVFDVMKFKEECETEQGIIPRILFVSHMNDISEQAQSIFLRYMPNLETTFFKTKQPDMPNADVTFATFQALNSELERFDPQDFEYNIFDEAHHTEAPTFKRVVEYFDPMFELALTATPERLDNLDIKEYFGDPVYSKTLAEAIGQGWLADVDYHIVFDDAVKEVMESGFEPKSLRELHELFMIRPRNEVIAKNVMEERHKIGLDNAKTIVFCESVEHAEEMAKLLGGKAYHSDVEKKVRSEILRSFRNGNQQVICTVDMFNEGIDIPDARLIIFLRSTSSPTIFEQQLGRGLRKTQGKEKVSVLDFVANVERIARVRELSDSVRHYTQSPKDSAHPPNESSTSDTRGLSIQTLHGSFDFDKLSIDLLEKFNTIRSTTGYSEHVTLTNEEIIELALLIKPEAPLNQNDIKQLSKEKRFVSNGNLLGRFGSLSAFQQACGFDVEIPAPRLGVQNMDNEDLIALARELKPEGPLGKTEIEELSKQRQFVSVIAVTRRFGSIGKFQEACGFEMSRTAKARVLTDEDVVRKAREIKPDGPLGLSEIDELSANNNFISFNAIKRRFGSLQAFQEACGFEPQPTQRKNNASNEDLIQLAQQIKPDAPLTGQEIKNLAKSKQFASYQEIKNRFGGVAEFARACGYEVADTSQLQDLTNDELVSLAQEINPNGVLSQRDIKKLSAEGKFVSNNVIVERFGSLINFQRASGTGGLDKKSLSRQMTDEEIIEAAKELSPDKPLTAKEINEFSKAGRIIGVSSLTRRFGSMAAFQRACGFKPVDARATTKALSAEDIIRIAKELKPYGILSSKEIDALSKEKRFVSTQAIRKRFGSIEAFHAACKNI